MDDILDLMEDVATAISLYDVQAVTSKRASWRTSARHLRARAVRGQPAVGHEAGEPDPEGVRGHRPLESEADRVLRSAMSKLFREEDNVKTLIKLKAIYELLETITDKCEDVANIIEGIVLENA
jgi:Phosphate transport regulator (distant homolog of PhoU)